MMSGLYVVCLPIPCVAVCVCRYGDFTTQSGTAEGLWYENGTIMTNKVKLLSRTYAQVNVK